MTIQPSPGADDSSLDDAQPDTADENEVGANDLEPTDTEEASSGGGQVSEAGGASLNAETTLGGADALPDAHG
ncbi:MAG: hypothetical protein WBG89_12335 [Ornithinimicrobium sp.]